jgi:predicted MFS family arabinose efflux permease
MAKIGKELRVTIVLALLMFTNIVDFMIIMPLSDLLIVELSLTAKQFSEVVASYSIAASLSGLFVSMAIDRFEKKKFLILIYTGFLVGTTLCGLSDSYITLLLARIFTGIFGGVLGALTFTIISDIVPVERRSTAMGALSAAFSLASVAGVPLGLKIADMWYWEMPFFFIVGFGLIVFVFIFLLIPKIPVRDNAGVKSDPLLPLKNLFTGRNQQIALLFMILLVLGQFTVIPFITPYLTGNVGHDFSWIPWVYVVGGLVTLISNPLVGRAADKFGRKRVFLIMCVLSVIPLFALTNLLPIQNFFGESANSYISLTVAALFFIFISGRMVPTNSLMTSIVEPQNRGGFMSLTSTFQQMGAGLAAYVAGMVVSIDPQSDALSGFDIVGYMAIGFTILAIILSFKLRTVEGN